MAQTTKILGVVASECAALEVGLAPPKRCTGPDLMPMDAVVGAAKLARLRFQAVCGAENS